MPVKAKTTKTEETMTEKAAVNDASSVVNHPSHYTSGRYECIDVINDWNLDFCLGNAVKYICRAGKKDPNKTVEDLQKAVFYLNYKINILKENK